MARYKQKNPASRKALKKPLQKCAQRVPVSNASAAVKRRWKPGTVALREIRKYQKSTALLLPKAPFRRLVREICDELNPRPAVLQPSLHDYPVHIRWTDEALLALQEAAEACIVGLFEDAVLLCIHRNAVTVMPKDWTLARRLSRNPLFSV